jgi:hypothetical protein
MEWLKLVADIEQLIIKIEVDGDTYKRHDRQINMKMWIDGL